MIKLIRKVVLITLVFCYIFGFSLNHGQGIDSTMIVGGFLVLYNLLSKPCYKKTIRLLQSTYCMNLIRQYFIIVLWIGVVLLLNGSDDVSYILTFSHMLFIIIVGFLLYCFIDNKNESKETINFIIIAFVFQTFIEWCGFLIPSFKELLNLTKSEATIMKGLEYGGIRANSLCGSDFFGLSAAFALLYVVFQSTMNTIFKNNRILKFLIFIILISGTFFAGRTGYTGLLVAALYFLLKHKKEVSKPYNKYEIISFTSVGGIIVFLIIYLIGLFNTDENFNRLFLWTFQNVFNYVETGSAQSTSTSHMFNDMYYFVDPFTFICGDGKYTLKYGSYYGATDVGYMRVVLYMGLIGLILLFVMQLSMLRINKGYEKNIKKAIFLILIILNAKGEIIVWNSVTLSVVSLFCITYHCHETNIFQPKQRYN